MDEVTESVEKKSRVDWSRAEWLLFVEKLDSAFPDMQLIKKGKLKGVTLEQVTEVIEATFPEERRRKLPHLGKIRNRVEGYAKLIRQGKVDEHQAQLEGVEGKRVLWSYAEYYAVAAEIHRRNKHENYPSSTTLAGLGPSDVKDAMRAALPRERWREGLKTMAAVRPGLLEAFKTVREDLDAEALRKAEEKERKQLSALSEPAPVLEAPADNTLTPEPTAAPVVVETAPQPATLDSLVAQVATRLADTFAEAFINQFTQRFKAAFSNLQTTIEAPQPAPQRPTVSAAPQQRELSTIQPAFKIVPFSPSTVLIVGPIPQQAREIEKSFPNIKFNIQSEVNSGTKELAKHYDRTIGMTSFMNHAADGMLAKAAGDKYTRVTGGVSAIKRQLEVWVHAGVLAAPHPHAA